MQIKSTTGSHFTPTGVLLSKRHTVTHVEKDIEKLEPSCIAGGKVKLYSHFGKQSGSSSKSYT